MQGLQRFGLQLRRLRMDWLSIWAARIPVVDIRAAYMFAVNMQAQQAFLELCTACTVAGVLAELVAAAAASVALLPAR